MLQFLADENFKGDIVRGLLRRNPHLNVIRVQDIGLTGADDLAVIAWAAERGRIILTHDRATLPDFAYERVAANGLMPGVFLVPRRMAVRQAIDELLLIATCTKAEEWAGRVLHLPL